MTHPSPILDRQHEAEAELLAYGAAQPGGPPIWVVAGFGPLELEYAAIRKDAALMDLPQRAVVEVRGPERREFLNRMLTQDLKAMAVGRVFRSFWLNKKGRIDADVRLIETGDRTLVELDVLAAARTVEGLARYIIMEDVSVSDITATTHRLALHGPRSLAVLSEASGVGVTLTVGGATTLTIAGVEVLVFREDSAAEVGLELILDSGNVAGTFQRLVDAGARPVGWHAWNVARIEGGTPLYNVDFGPESLPAETGVLNDRVSFTKGCYLGQEIVARLHARGHPKQVVVSVKFDSHPEPETGLPIQPMGGAPLCLVSDPENPIGSVSSSTLAPMVGSAPISLASVRFAHAAPGTELVTQVGTFRLRGKVQPSLRFWPG